MMPAGPACDALLTVSALTTLKRDRWRRWCVKRGAGLTAQNTQNYAVIASRRVRQRLVRRTRYNRASAEARRKTGCRRISPDADSGRRQPGSQPQYVKVSPVSMFQNKVNAEIQNNLDEDIELLSRTIICRPGYRNHIFLARQARRAGLPKKP